MNQILLTLGGLTLGGSAAVILLALLGRNPKSHYGARWRCWAWLLLCLRLAVPLPLLSLLQTAAPIQVDLPNPPAVTHPQPQPGGGQSGEQAEPPAGEQNNQHQPGPAGGTASAQLSPADPVQPQQREERPAFSTARILLAVWLAGAAVMLVWSTWAHMQFLSYLRRWAAPVTEPAAVQAFNQLGDQLGLDRRPQLLVCQGLKVPMLAGLLRPALLLPRGSMTGEELGLSLLHELTHYRRRDIWLKTLAMWVNALHWFNPLAWYLVRLVERDTELACDEAALRRLPPELYSAYGQTILAAVARLEEKPQ